MKHIVEVLPALISGPPNVPAPINSTHTLGPTAAGERDVALKLKMMEIMMQTIKLDYKSETRITDATHQTYKLLKEGVYRTIDKNN